MFPELVTVIDPAPPEGNSKADVPEEVLYKLTLEFTTTCLG